MIILQLPDANFVATEAARRLAKHAREAVADRGVFTLAVSGGTTPWQMLRALANEVVPWPHVHVFQVDERVAPPGDTDRNLTRLRESLLSHAPLPAENLHPMPVNEPDLIAASQAYASELERVAGAPAVLDVVHLGLGADGHTASLIPDDPVLEVADRDVALCGVYQGRQRLTLTYPIINRARVRLWPITGEAKREMLTRLLRQDVSIPAGRVLHEHAAILTDLRV
jgi:6-phosphogluconolactonase